VSTARGGFQSLNGKLTDINDRLGVAEAYIDGLDGQAGVITEVHNARVDTTP
jgi:hypothetical protein